MSRDALKAAMAVLTMAVLMGMARGVPAYPTKPTTSPDESWRSAMARVIYVADDAEAADALAETIAPSPQVIERRRQQYAAGFLIAAGILVIAIVIALIYGNPDAAAAVMAALGALGIGALLQFTTSKGLPMLLWPPPRLWLGTFAADFSLAVMLAAVGGTMLRPGLRRVIGAVVIAEIAWWGIPALAGAAGLTLSIVRHPMSMDWLVFLGTTVGAIAAPAAGWAVASLASMIAGHVVPARA